LSSLLAKQPPPYKLLDICTFLSLEGGVGEAGKNNIKKNRGGW